MDGEEVPETQEDVEDGVDGESGPADEHAPLQLVYVGEERPRSVPEVILLHPLGAPTLGADACGGSGSGASRPVV